MKGLILVKQNKNGYSSYYRRHQVLEKVIQKYETTTKSFRIFAGISLASYKNNCNDCGESYE